MAVQKGSHKRADRKQPPPASLGPREENEDGGHVNRSTHSAAVLALAARQKGAGATSSPSKKLKRGNATGSLARAKAQKAMENADRLHTKAGKRAIRDEKRKRAKDTVR